MERESATRISFCVVFNTEENHADVILRNLKRFICSTNNLSTELTVFIISY